MVVAAGAGPFGAEGVDEVILPAAPLARVICQIRFPRLTRLVTGDDAANGIASVLADRYPVFNHSREFTLMITPDGVTKTPSDGQVWQLGSADGSWQVSFGADFLALHTDAYTMREAFTDRLAIVLQAFGAQVSVPHCDRIGVRYINRVDLGNVSLEELPALVRPEMLGGLAVPREHVGLAIAMNEALYDLAPPPTPGPPAAVINGLQARWGLLPPGALLDPTLPVLPRASWVLDLDAFQAAESPFTGADVLDRFRELAKRAYRYFRWVVTDDYLRRFGGET